MLRFRLPRSALSSLTSTVSRRLFSVGTRVMGAKIVDYSHFLTKTAQAREDSPIRALQPLINMPGMLSLGGGNPNAEMFPFAKVAIDLNDGSTISIDKTEIKRALQYTYTQGYPPFLEKVRLLMDHLYKPKLPAEEWSSLVTSGSQDGLSRVFEAILDDDSAIVVEDPVYPGAVAALKHLPGERVAVRCDNFGIIPERLEAALSQRSASERVIKAIYMIPTGQNPSGATMNTERKKAIYDICSRYNILILEDDPYALLSLPRVNQPHNGEVLKPQTTFFGMDTEGRVVRFDSLSKIVSSGLRIGWLSGPNAIVRPINRHIQATSLHTSTLIQALVAKLLDHWGLDGFDKHIVDVQKFYAERRDWFEESAQRHLRGFANWDTPEAGLFFWLKVPGMKDTEPAIRMHSPELKVVAVPGKACKIDERPSSHIRCAYSNCTRGELDEALTRLARLVKEERFHVRDEEF